MSRRAKILLGAGAAAVVVVAAGVGLWLWLRDDAPPPVSLDEAVESAEGDEGTEGTGSDADLDGVWTVDTAVGDPADVATGSFVGYRVDEELLGIGVNTAVGRTPAVTGTLTVEGTSATAVDVEADLTQLASDDDRRDGRMRTQGLETDPFPTATFSLTDPLDFGDVPEDGTPLQVTAAGELTIHGTTRPVEIDLEAQIVDDVIVVVGSLPITFDDYGIPEPTSPIVVSIADSGVMELQLFFARSEPES